MLKNKSFQKTDREIKYESLFGKHLVSHEEMNLHGLPKVAFSFPKRNKTAIDFNRRTPLQYFLP